MAHPPEVHRPPIWLQPDNEPRFRAYAIALHDRTIAAYALRDPDALLSTGDLVAAGLVAGLVLSAAVSGYAFCMLANLAGDDLGFLLDEAVAWAEGHPELPTAAMGVAG